jgi:uncharacterized membrane protein (UPF0127 family)
VKVKIKDITIPVETASGVHQIARGLSGRDSLQQDSGMLFLFDRKYYYNFWMRGMRFPIDIAMIDNGEIVDAFESVQPPRDSTPSRLAKYSPSVPVDVVLEVNAGFLDRNGINVGDKVEIIRD